MTPPKKDNLFTNVLNFMQLIVLVIGVAGVFLVIGRKDHQVDSNTTDIIELTEITRELVRAQVESAGNDALHLQILQDIRFRLERLEIDRFDRERLEGRG